MDDGWQQGKLLLKEQHITNATEQYILNNCHSQNVYPSETKMTKQILNKFKFADLYEPNNEFTIYWGEIDKSSNTPTKLIQKDDWGKLKNIADDKYMRSYNVGDVVCMGDGEKKRFVLNIFTHKWPGLKPTFPATDGFDQRFANFKICMDKIYQIQKLESFAISKYFVGGNFNKNILWQKIEEELRLYAKKFPHIKTVIYLSEIAKKVSKAAANKNMSTTDKLFELEKNILK